MLIVFCTPVAVLGDNGGQQIKLNAADMAAARRSVIELGHFDGAPGWKGGPKRPNLSSPAPSCPKYNYHPKQSDLVVTGAAESVFRGQGVYFDSAAEVLQDQVMVSNDFVRSVWAPGSLRCLGHYFAKGLRPRQRLLSFRRIRFPRVAQFVAEFRAVISVPVRGHPRVRVIADTLFLAEGRSEVTLLGLTPVRNLEEMVLWERHLADLLIAHPA